MGAHLLINGWFWDQTHTGSGQYLHGLLRHLPAALPGWDITVLLPAAVSRQPLAIDNAPSPRLPIAVTSPPSPPPPASSPPRLLAPTFNLQPATFPPFARGARLRKLAWEQYTFPRHCLKLKADVAFVPYWGSPLWTPCPTLVVIHDLIPLLLDDYAVKSTARAYTWLVAHSARRAAAVITVSRSAHDDIVRHLGIPPERVHIAYEGLGVPHAPVTDPAELDRVRRAYDLPPRYLFYLGGFDPRKNVPSAAGRLRPRPVTAPLPPAAAHRWQIA